MSFYTFDVDNNQIFRLDGDVGIGTTNPGEKLTVTTGTNYDGITLRNEDSNALAKIARHSDKDESYFVLYDGGLSGGVASKKVELTSFGDSFFNAGNVGIKTNNPSEALDVSGNIISRGNVGIGTTDPQFQLHTYVDTGNSHFMQQSDNNKMSIMTSNTSTPHPYLSLIHI